jgi:hypothetical protein
LISAVKIAYPPGNFWYHNCRAKNIFAKPVSLPWTPFLEFSSDLESINGSSIFPTPQLRVKASLTLSVLRVIVHV